MPQYNIFDRRQFLRGLGSAFLGAPLLAGSARAQSTPVAKRLVVFFTPNGTSQINWRPTGNESQFQFAPGST
jgi:hypothetical protein